MTTTMDPEAHPWRRARLSPAALVGPVMVLAAFAVTLFTPAVLNDGDTFWHLATGRHIIETGAVPHADPFSYTMPGRDWQPHEWLADVIMAGAFALGGWAGLLVLMGACAALAVGLIARQAGRSLSATALVVTLALSFACMGPSLLARPHLMALPLIVLWASEMIAARERNSAPRLWLVAVMALWANLHGSYVFGFVLLAPFALEALIEAPDFAARRKAVLGWGLVGVLSLAAAALTPHGVKGVHFPLELMSMQTLDGIIEWRSADFTTIGPFEIALLATLFVCLRFGVKIPILRLILLLFLLHMALRHGRHLIVLGAVAPLILAGPIASALSSPPAGSPPRAVLAATLALLIALAGVRLAMPFERTDGDTAPVTAFASVPEDIRRLPVLNEYGFGGYLINAGVPVYIDGRADMYGDAFFARYFRMAQGDAGLLEETLGQHHVGWTIFPPTHPLTPLMDAQPGWRRLYDDDYAVVHVRTGE